ncbi:hypothetical protein AB0J40_47315 [Amycolatopsis sp. NPDC049691]|uniref:Uncharacterized protein n=1 Tax=Amycolatopsis pretoriensis TaxID=218821 RepID=A0A1H5Q5N8_9PSEU|nr:hypothetical protein [Amycolatopsis pretoriensis]NUS56938.1 hypothetical protein [Streptomycetaceae bacterium]SEF20731.1 hypothetical protein SAMN05421837_101508 [Amycolatopsis pretoriensis]
MTFDFVGRWLGRHRDRPGISVDLSCGGRVTLREIDGQPVLAITTAPGPDGRCSVAAVPLSEAERRELGQVLGPDVLLAS